MSIPSLPSHLIASASCYRHDYLDGSCNTSETAQPVAGLEVITATANVSFAT